MVALQSLLVADTLGSGADSSLLKKKTMRKLIENILIMASQEKLTKSTIRLAVLDGTVFESHYVCCC